MSTHRIPLAVTGLALAAVLAACGGGAAGPSGADGSRASSSAAATSYSDADVTFAQQMTGHHEQAVEMAQLAADRAGSAEVRDLADRIEAAQGPEIETMTGWLDDWGAEVPMSGMDHGAEDGGDMPGGMSAEEMDRLGSLRGSDFDREWLTMMISHHQGAVEMAEAEQADGTHPEAVALAGGIVADQTAEITEMQELLGRL